MESNLISLENTYKENLITVLVYHPMGDTTRPKLCVITFKAYERGDMKHVKFSRLHVKAKSRCHMSSTELRK